jgi:hypothetical protein
MRTSSVSPFWTHLMACMPIGKRRPRLVSHHLADREAKIFLTVFHTAPGR